MNHWHTGTGTGSPRCSSITSCGAVFIPPIIAAILSLVDSWDTTLKIIGFFSFIMIPLSIPVMKPKDKPGSKRSAASLHMAHGTVLETTRGPASAAATDYGSGSGRPDTAGTSSADITVAARNGDKGEDEEEEDIITLTETFTAARRSRSYILLVIGFFACGFHVIFVSTHLPAFCDDAGLPSWVGPTSITLIGVGNIVGTFIAGWLASKYEKWKGPFLGGIYFLRGCLMLMMAFAELSTALVLFFAVTMGILWLSTVPLTAGLVNDMVGLKFNSTFFGFAFASHQIGSFFGSWLGGRIYDQEGDYYKMWITCACVGFVAAGVHLPITAERIKGVCAICQCVLPLHTHAYTRTCVLVFGGCASLPSFSLRVLSVLPE